MPARIDDVTRFSDAQSLAGGTSGTAVASTNVVDLYDLMHRVGQSPHVISVRVFCDESFNNITSEEFALQDSADNATFTNTDLVRTVALADLVAGYELLNERFPVTGPNGTFGPLGTIGAGASPIRRYVRFAYTPTFATAATTGKVTSFIDVA